MNPTANEHQRNYRVALLADAGFMIAYGEYFRLTNAGHDYLDAIRDDGVWKKTKEVAAGVGGVTLGIMKDISVAYLKQLVVEKMGITLS